MRLRPLWRTLRLMAPEVRFTSTSTLGLCRQVSGGREVTRAEGDQQDQRPTRPLGWVPTLAEAEVSMSDTQKEQVRSFIRESKRRRRQR